MSELLFGQVNGIHAAVAFMLACGFAIVMAARGDHRAVKADEVFDSGLDVDAIERAATVADWSGDR